MANKAKLKSNITGDSCPESHKRKRERIRESKYYRDLKKTVSVNF